MSIAKKFAAGAIVALTTLGMASTSFAAAYTNTMTLRQGSTGAAVVALQSCLNSLGNNVGTADGSFGPMTKSGVMAFQASHSLVADGIVGPASNAKLALACAGDAPADNQDNNNDGDTNVLDFALDGAESTIDNIDIRNDDDSFKEGEQNVELATITADVSDSDILTERVDVVLQFMGATGAGASLTARGDGDNTKPWDVFDSISLEINGEEVASMDTNSRSDWNDGDYVEDDALNAAATDLSHDYRLRFSNFKNKADAVTKEGDELEIKVIADISNNITLGTNGSSEWTVAIPVDGVRDVDAAALTNSFPSNSPLSADFTIGAINGDDKLTVSSSTNDPVAGTVMVDDTTTSSWIKIGSFKAKADEDGSDLSIGTASVRLTINDPADVEDIEAGEISDLISDVKLKAGSNEERYNSADVVTPFTTGADTAAAYDFNFDFDNDLTIDAGDTQTFDVYAKFKGTTDNYDPGTTVTASLSNASMLADWAVTGADDELTGSQLAGSYTGKAHELRVEGISVDFVSVTNGAVSTAQAEDTTDNVTVTFVYDVTAVGTDVYVDGTVTEDGDGTYAAGQGNSFYVTRADTGATAAALTDVAAALSSVAGGGAGMATASANTTWKVDEGTTDRFVLTVNVANTLTDNATNDALLFKTALMSIGWDTSAIAATANNYTFNLDQFVSTPVLLGEFDAV